MRKRSQKMLVIVALVYISFQTFLMLSSFRSEQTTTKTNRQTSNAIQVIGDVIVSHRVGNITSKIYKNLTVIVKRNTTHFVRSFPSREVFQPLDTSHLGYVISAIESRPRQLIIFGTIVRQMRTINASRCQFFASINQSHEPLLETTKSERKVLEEHHGRKYGAAYFTCPLPPGLKPYAVSLVAERCGNPSNFITIQYAEEQRWEFTVCVTPLNYRYSKAYELVEMIELNRLLGADQVVFYNYSTNYNVDMVLRYYMEQGIVQVVQWHLPMKVNTWPKIKGRTVEIHYFGQLAALNDCLYRNRYRSKFIVYQDLDEFIIPHKHKNWKEMLTAIGDSRAVFMFRNVFFRKEWNDTSNMYPGKDIALKYRAVTLLKLQREDKIFGPRHRSKYIVNPRLVDIVGIHNVWKARQAGTTYNVHSEVALLHHYRNWENPHDPIRRINDQTTMKYKDQLITRLKNTWEKLKHVPLGPL